MAVNRDATSLAPLGDRAILVTLGDAIDERTHRRVRAAAAKIDAAGLAGVVELVPAYTSIVVHYTPSRVTDPEGAPYDALASRLRSLLEDVEDVELPPSRLVEIPVVYGGDGGPDLPDVAARHGLSADEVVALHASAEYLVYMVGFVPGFGYLGGLPERLATPRRREPRTAVPAGSVGIGGAQTGVYPMVSPGGWNLIGRTSLVMFDAAREPASLLSIGDRVRFVPVDATARS